MRLRPTKPRAAQTGKSRGRSTGGRQRCAAEPAGSTEELRQQLQEQLLTQIRQGGKLCRALERELSQNPTPELETLIALHRVLVLNLSLEANASPAVLRQLCDLMKPVMEWARLQEKRKDRELAELKHRDTVESRKAAKEEPADADALTPETLQKIQSELKLF